MLFQTDFAENVRNSMKSDFSSKTENGIERPIDWFNIYMEISSFECNLETHFNCFNFGITERVHETKTNKRAVHFIIWKVA